ncbi:MAG: hypothetical protein A3F84_20860 [Candidatus Handelsmanbacteria bacterium RIFCSPLOWO2_12_FULL_64_10]|uniref:Uncharacterized protein n=1 Tax=Handelsmanbacteria sp. (strain RIFCSPLOWO2_12_FULL_64_10) TaxID=1817868 RepID=A0A1F6D4R1_HANXR|nr:MAG: hypothetical protein A3F84_20860 [Candidatus Handelsmanbacteria bacterium RIFCSPLOWO2_12_FULL_64_10]
MLCCAAVLTATSGSSAQDLAEELRRAVAEARHADAVAILAKAEPEDFGWSAAELEMVRARYQNLATDYVGAEASARKGLGLATAELPSHIEANCHLEVGVACFNQKRYEEAIPQLRVALDQGCSEPGMARSHLGAALAMTDNMQEAQKEFEKAIEDLEPGSLAYQSAQDWRRNLSEGGGPAAGDRNWGVKLRAGLGHNSNALQFNVSDSQLPGGVSDRSSFFFDAGVDAYFDPYRGQEDGVRIYDSVAYRHYEDARSFSRVTNTLGATYFYQVDPQLQLGVDLRWQISWLMNPGRKFYRQYVPSLYGEYKWDEYNTTYATVSHAWTDYVLAGNRGVRDPDSRTWTIRAQHKLFLDEAKTLALIPSAGAWFSSADGDDWDNTGYDVSAALSWQATEDLSVTGGVRVAWTDFDHVHSFSSRPKEREDVTTAPFVSATYQFTPYFGVTALAAWTSNNSNINEFRYDDFQYALLPYLDIGELVTGALGGD